MKKFLSRLAILSLILSASSVFAQATPAEPAEKPWYEKVEFSGFVDVYFMYNGNNKEGRNPDTTGGLNTYNKQFQVAAVELDIEKVADKESPWGFRIDFQNGTNNPYQENPYTAVGGTYNMNLLQQAYVSFYFDVLGGLTVDMGKMATHIGYEVIESMDNLNYNVGYIFFNTVPFINTGARANLALNDNWSLGLFLYNSAGGTGADAALYANGKNGYGDGNTRRKAVGTQLSGTIIEGKLDVTWNTLYGIDGQTGRQNNADVWVSESTGVPLLPKEAGRNDYWSVNNVIIEITPTDKFYLALDYTQGEKGGAAGNAYDGNQFTTPVGDLSLARSDAKARYTYRTYGIWAKYDFTDTFALALRYEKIDDSRNGGALGVGGRIGANERYDLQYNNTLGYRNFYLGSAQTFTVTPTYKWGENVIVKLDLRRDQAQGSQFVNEKGQPTSHQNGATLGVVAKF
ncbi:outer membrane beta-barrel protein [Leptospira sp. GIMC2001]|uniref:outer membrane beta-barrel protein n=1 Tax=Leptospira sp. GIMC2001 TaxID=1513297 RepID=UPI00234A8947|nr:outer membrane beta-barrel protein [Leptospira sp. GIMC2001]WCL49949.1 outer membrane beta-barrel protein [Leptospira sp. GIMC2001]